MVHASVLYTTVLAVALAAGNPIVPRAVDKLNDDAFKEAQQRDDTATRAKPNVQIKTADGRCLFVDALSGDFRANLTPLQIADCGSQAGQGFDIITSGKHNDQTGQALVVSSLTQACLSFDPRRPADSQVHLFSCGGRADGGGEVSNSQLFAFDGKQDTIALTPQNNPGKCLVTAGNKVIIGNCDDKDDKQKFTFGSDAGSDGDKSSNGGKNGGDGNMSKEPSRSSSTAMETSTVAMEPSRTSKSSDPMETSAPFPLRSPASSDEDLECTLNLVTVVNTVTVTVSPQGMNGATNVRYSTIYPTETSSSGKKAVNNNNNNNNNGNGNGNGNGKGGKNDNSNNNASKTSNDNGMATTTTTRYANGQHTANPTDEVPVSRAGTKLNPTAAAEANTFDSTARRALESVNLRAADGRCLTVDPTSGDFRQNLIPVGLATCSEDPQQKFDVVTQGKHNDGKDSKALLVSVLTNGCLSFDNRRQQGDTVTLFSCGGRADGGMFLLIFTRDSGLCDV